MVNKTVDINESLISQYIESIRPEDPEIRKQLDMGYSYKNQLFVLFEIRPDWLNPDKKEQIDFAKIRYYKTQKIWKLYWARASGKWELYEPYPEASHLSQLIEVIKKDSHGCFFG